MLNLEQQIVQILCQRSSSEALQAIAAAIGAAWQIDCCLIAPLALAQTACWTSQPLSDRNAAVAQLRPLALAALGSRDRSEVFSTTLESLRLDSLLALRLHFQTDTVGVLLLGRSPSNAWSQADDRWQQFCPLVALGITQVQLQQQLQQHTCYQNWTQRFSEAMSATGDINRIFALAVEATIAGLPIDRALVLLLKYSHPQMKQRRHEGRSKRYRLSQATLTLACSSEAQSSIQSSFRLTDCDLYEQVLLMQPEPVAISGLEGTVAIDAPPLQLSEFPALLLMPLSHQDTVLGFLVLQARQPLQWQADMVAWVKLIATQLSTAMIQTHTFKQIHALVDDRTAQLQRSLEVQAKLYEKMRQQVDQLRQMNRLKDEFLSTMSHELRTPLTSMTLAIRMLRQSELSSERQQRYLDILEQQCIQETNLINDLLALQALDSTQSMLQIHRVDLTLLINDLAESFETTWASKNLTLAIDLPDQSLTIYTNLDSLTRIVAELLTNAGKYAAAASGVDLQVRCQADRLVLALSNLGTPILPDELPHIFDKFWRGQGVTEQAIPGTGLGLALVKSLVVHLKGTIEATSEPQPSGLWRTCLTLTLPERLNSPVEA